LPHGSLTVILPKELGSLLYVEKFPPFLAEGKPAPVRSTDDSWLDKDVVSLLA
jgi:hypothetical protein